MLASFLALVMLAALAAYSLLAGADFGGGIWDLVSRGRRAAAQRDAIAHALGPVWEANHVWLIFLIVLLFTCFPAAYAAASVALFWPLHFVLIGIVLRGASFVFRAYGGDDSRARALWGAVFGAASAVTPVLLGACLGAISSGAIRAEANAGVDVWLARFPLAVGVLALLVCAYVAAVYLAWETTGELRDDFRRRALVIWLVAGIASVAVLFLARVDAPRLWERLTTMPAVLVIAAGAALAPLSCVALYRERYQQARVFGAGQVVVLIGGWAAAQWPFLIYPAVTVQGSAAPEPTLVFTVATLPFGMVLLLPSLWYLFAVFKRR